MTDATIQRREGADAEAGFAGPNAVYAFADSMSERANDHETVEAEKQLETWVTFVLAGEVFALPVTATQEILRVGTVTRVPHAPRTVRGIINMRGRVIPVVDLRARLDLPTADLESRNRVLIVSARGRVLGLLVDAVLHVVQLDRLKVDQPPADVMTAQSEYLIGVYQLDKTLLILLDIERVLVVPEAHEASVAAFGRTERK